MPAKASQDFSPLLRLLDEHVSPERLYLETKWASLISFELAAHLLKDTLPVAETVNAAGVRNHLHRVAERAEAALGDEKVSFIEGCPREWAALPHPQPPLTIGVDGCYVRQWEDKKAHFEVIVGKSMAEDGPSRCFGFVQDGGKDSGLCRIRHNARILTAFLVNPAEFFFARCPTVATAHAQS